MNDLQEAHEILNHAAKLGPKNGLAYLAGYFNSGKGVAEFIKAVHSYTDENGEIREDAPEDIRALCEAARESLLG